MKNPESSPFGNWEPVWGFLLTAIYIVGMPYVFYPPLMRMVDDVRLHYSGTVAKQSDCWVFSYQGTRYSTWKIHVAYTAQDGRQHAPDVDTFMWWRKPDDSKPCTVRYDPASPDHVSTDWGLERLFGRVVSYLILLPLPLLGELVALGLMIAFVSSIGRRPTPLIASPRDAAASRPGLAGGWRHPDALARVLRGADSSTKSPAIHHERDITQHRFLAGLGASIGNLVLARVLRGSSDGHRP